MKQPTRVIFYVMLFLSSTTISTPQVKESNSAIKKTAAINFTVNHPGETNAWDDPKTDKDESTDGICSDENGNCTITAAIQEAVALDQPVVLTFSSSMTIALAGGEGAQFLSGSKILGGGNNIKIIFGTPAVFEFEDGNEIKGVDFENGGLSFFGSNNIVKACTFKGTIISPVPIAINGTNNIIGGLNEADRNIINGASFGIEIAMDESMEGGFNQILGNYIGVTSSGSLADGNIVGIAVQGESGQGKNIIDGNVISGNTSHGILISSSDSNIIRNNKIGTDASGSFAVANKNNGIHLFNAQRNLIEKNIISGNSWSGISFNGSSESVGEASFNVVKFNFVGVNNNEAPIPNEKHGIEIIGKSSNNIIGSSLETDADTNVIAHNSLYGIIVIPDTLSGSGYPQKNIFRRNRMYGNSNPGILIDTLTLTQEKIARPFIDSIQRNQSQELIVHGMAKPSSVVDAYLSSNADPLKYGEGKTWLGKGTTSDSGKFVVNIGATQLDCDFITVLQTDVNSNTSGNALNYGLRPNIVLLTQTCAPPLFGGVAFADNTYTIHIDWKGMPKTGELEFTLNGNKKNGTIEGDLGKVDFNMSQSVVGLNTLKWELKTCDGRSATGLSLYQFCGNPVPEWLAPLTAKCSGGHILYTHEETFPNVSGAAEGLAIPNEIAFVGGLLLSFADAPTFNTTLNIPGESTPLKASTSFNIGDFSTSFSISGTVSTAFNGCDDIVASGTVSLSAGVSKSYTHGFSFGNIPCPSLPGLEQACQIANSMANVLRIGATLSGEITGTANVIEGIEITRGSGGATLALIPFLDIATFHARGTGQVVFSFEVPSFSVTNVDASVTVNISEALSGLTKSWSFPSGGLIVQQEDININKEKNIHAQIPYKSFIAGSVGTDTTLEEGIAWNAKPAFAVGPNGKKAFVWTIFSMSGQNKVSDIAMKYFNGSQWSSILQLTNDDNIDRNPAITFDNNDNIIICWERNTLAQTIPDSLQYSSSVMKNFNLMYSVRSSVNGTQFGSGNLGTSNTYDALPKLAKGKDGTVMLAWQIGNGENLFGTDDAPMRLAVARQWNGTQWNSVDTIQEVQSKIFQWDFAVQNDLKAIIVLAKDTQGDLSTGNDWEIFTVERTDGVWQNIQQLTSNAKMEYGVKAAYFTDGTPSITWMRDTSIVGSIGAVSSSQEIWIPKAGMGFFESSFTIGKDTMVLLWNEGTSAVMATASVNQREWSKPKFLQFSSDIQRSISAQFDTDGFLHFGFQQSPYNSDPAQLSDSGFIRLISIENTSSSVGVHKERPELPKQFALFNAYPNPFNPSTEIRYQTPEGSYVTLKIYDLLGREVATLVNEELKAGVHSVRFDASDLSSGMYIYTLRAGDFVASKKLLLMK